MSGNTLVCQNDKKRKKMKQTLGFEEKGTGPKQKMELPVMNDETRIYNKVRSF